MHIGDPPQPPQDRSDVRAEHPAQDVGLVHGHYSQVAQEICPGLVVGQDADVEHVGVGEDHVRAASHVGPYGLGRVAVVGRRVDAAQPEGPYLPQLVLGQRLRRVEKQGLARRALERVLEGRYLVARDLPLAVAVATTTFSPAHTRSQASRWWEYSRSTPSLERAAMSSGCRSGGSTRFAGRGGRLATVSPKASTAPRSIPARTPVHDPWLLACCAPSKSISDQEPVF